MKNRFQRYLPPTKWRNPVFILLATLPVVIFLLKFSLLYRHGIFYGEDWDYFSQTYEAARISILHYHQFPWWNPWMNGGQPLFANPQFGLFSLQMPLILLFGTVMGLHLSVLLYYVLGFWGMYMLLQRIGCNDRLMAILLSYIWLFSGFSAWHIAGGHFTFAVYLLSPWAFLTILNIGNPRGWLWFGLVTSLLIQTAAHYLTVEALVICAIIGVIQIIKQLYPFKKISWHFVWQTVKPYVLASLLVLVVCAPRLIYSLQFTHQYPRLEDLDPSESIKLFIASLTFRHAVDPAALTTMGNTHYGWSEYANYIGLGTLGLLSYWVIRRLEKVRSISLQEWLIAGATVLAALISLGAFWILSPFNILHHLPVFEQMRVPSRFIAWVGLGIVLMLSRLPRTPLFYGILIISVLDVFSANYAVINYPQAKYVQAHSNRQFQQYEFYQTDPSLGVMGIMNIQNLRLLRATQQNYGEVYGYEPILNTAEFYFLPGTNRCGINKGCEFVVTKNAKVISWSPHHIKLQRTAPGAIKLNMNPGKVWYVNGQKAFPKSRILELQQDFTITDKSNTIDVQFHPTLKS